MSQGTARNSHPERPTPPGASRRAEHLARRVAGPIERFLHVEAASGIVLLLTAMVAMLWANSSAAHVYHALWETKVGITIGGLRLEQTIHFLINDGLMVIFFFVVGLEIRREMYDGELADRRRAMLPLAAALGGMILPAGLYMLLAPGTPEAARGWGVPMATDIAFAVGVLAVLGKRVPPALRVLLLALAIIDDIGAILVIALFYSSGIQLAGLGVAAAGALLIVAMQMFAVRAPLAYVAPGLVVWAGVLAGGIHPTIAGVIVGLLTPARAWLDADFHRQTEHAMRQYEAAGADTHARLGALGDLRLLSREAVAPVVRLQVGLHPWVAFVIMPVFALANAGVTIGEVSLSGDGGGVALAIGVGLVVGKGLGIAGASWAAVKAGIATLPSGVDIRGLAVVGLVGGVGFTMSLFVAGLAFVDLRMLGAAKLGVLLGSAVAGVLGLIAGWLLLRGPHQGASSATAAERSTEH